MKTLSTLVASMVATPPKEWGAGMKPGMAHSRSRRNSRRSAVARRASYSPDETLPVMRPTSVTLLAAPRSGATSDEKHRSSGSKESTYQPSRLQKRKHQINSLAAQCAEQRVELEQRMRHGSKSKAQTAAKYGW